jgi:nitrogen fixation protein FixH
LIFVLLGINAAIVLATAFLAGSDPSFAIEPNYYQKAVNWDQTAHQRERNRALAWRIDLAAVQKGDAIALRLSDSAGAAIEHARVAVAAFHHANANHRLQTELVEIEPGMYRSNEGLLRSGLWELQIEAQAGNATFTHTEPLIVGAGG